MRVLVACKRGNVADRDKWGHCLCVDCRAVRTAYRRRTAGAKLAYKREWLKRNPEKSSQYSAKWIEANPDKRAAVVQSWRDRNPDKVAAMSSRAGRRWAAANKGKRNASVKARQHAKRRAMPPWADRDAIAAFYVEAARLTAATGVPHEVDHIAPIQSEYACGLHVPANLRVVTRTLNRSKRNRMETALCVF